jgi:beta-glucanase (GH16 family)
VFSIEWDSNSIRWFLDGKQFNAIAITPAAMSEFQEAFFFIFNVAVGGRFPGYPDSSSEFPQRMQVDYIRVFERQ